MSAEPRDYRVFVERLAPHLGGGFVAYAPDLMGCVSDGESPDAALQNIYDAIACWIETADDRGEEVPQPSPRPQYA